MTIEIDENDLHAYLDGQLAPEQEAVVLAWLETDPEARQRLHDYAEQKLLTAIGVSEDAGEADPERTEELAEELGARLQQALTKRRPCLAASGRRDRGAGGGGLDHQRACPPLHSGAVADLCRGGDGRSSGVRRGADAAGRESRSGGVSLPAGCRRGLANRWRCPN